MDHPREVTDQLDFKGIIGCGPKRHLIDQAHHPMRCLRSSACLQRL
jgi:hypothetical protein